MRAIVPATRLRPVQAVRVSRPSGGRLTYQPALDGLRALAIVAVLVYHAAPAALPGGFLGVEVFFVLSGYLITALLLAEWQHHQRLDLGAFWQRRARRLVPAIVAVLLATLAVTAAFLPDELASLRGDALAAAGYVANWHLILEQRSYFETIGRPALLQHLWSLAVEEQFYLLWPILLLVGLRWLPRRLLVGLVLAGALASMLLLAWLSQASSDPSRAYYGTDTRAGGLLLGAALALVWSRRQLAVPAALLHLAALGALAFLLLASVLLTESTALLYRGGFAAVDVAVVVLIAAVVHPRARLEASLLGGAVLRWLGQRSYSLYVWHWPVFALSRPQLDVPLDGWPLLLLRLGLVLGVADVSYRWIERPIRSGALGRVWQAWRTTPGTGRRRRAVPGLAAVAAVVGYAALVAPAVAAARPPETPAYLVSASIDTWQAAVAHTPQAAGLPTALAAEPAPAAVSDAPTPLAADAPAPGAPDDTAAPLLALPTPATAGDATLAAAPDPTPPPAPASAARAVRSVAAVGDSVLLGAAPALEGTFAHIQIDAVVGRQVQTGLEILRAKRAAGALPDTVIVHLGNNGTFTDDQADALLDVLADVRRIVFVNLTVPRAWEAPNNAVIAAAVQRSSNAVLADWHAASAGRPELFWDDGMHLRPHGADVYAALIAAAVGAP